MIDKNLLADIMKEVKADKKEKNWPDHVVAQAGIVNGAAGDITNTALKIKYQTNRTGEDDFLNGLLKKQAIKLIARSLRFLENLK